MIDSARQQKITFAEMRVMGRPRRAGLLRRLQMQPSIAVSADRVADDLRLSDIEGQFTCTKCGKRGAEVRPDFKKKDRN